MKRIPESKQNLELNDTFAKIVKELSALVMGQFEFFWMNWDQPS